MLTNAQILLGIIALAREIVKLLREKRACPTEVKTKVEQARKAVKEKDKDTLKDILNELFY